MAFKLNGKPIAAIAAGTLDQQIRKVVDKLPDDELLDADEIGAKIGHRPERILSNAGKLDQSITTKIRVGTRQRRVFGNPKTIKKLLAGLERA